MEKLPADFLLILLFICTISCRRSGDKMTNLKVVEYKTNKPVSGAIINLYTMGEFDNDCHCWSTKPLLKKQTDENGVCLIGNSDFNQAQTGITLSKENYWPVGNPFFVSRQTTYEMAYIGQLKLHLIKSNAYPETATLGIVCKGEQVNSITSPFTYYPLPVDSSFTMDAFGGQINAVCWTVYDSSYTVISSGGPLSVDVAKSGVTEMEIKF
jgi:hypothetical protein